MDFECVAKTFLSFAKHTSFRVNWQIDRCFDRNLPDPTGTAAVVAKPAGAAGEEKTEGGINALTTSCGALGSFEKNVNMALNEIAMQNGCVPEWTLVAESGPQHQKVSF